jgi:lysophospholipase L1-like esterase
MSRISRSPARIALAVSICLPVPARSEPRNPTHVACVGDSITEGAGASSTANNYPSQLQKLLTLAQVKNFGKSGATLLTAPYGDKPYTQQVEYTDATSFVSGAGAGAVVSVVIILGANDSKPFNWEPGGKPKNDQQYLKDYRALVDHFLALSPKPVVYVGYPLATGTNPCCDIRGNVILNEQLPLLKQVAVEKRLPIIDLNTPTTGHPEYFGDGVHPTDAGYAVLAGLVKAGLAREPKVTITSPMSGATLEGGSQVALSADAGDSTVDFTSVEFFEGDTSLGKATTKPFTISWAAPAGAHQVTAKATDTTLASGTSAAVAFTVSAAGGGGSSTGGAVGQGGAGSGGSASAGRENGGATSTGGVSSAGAAGAPASAAGSSVSSVGGAAGSATSAAPRKPDAGCGCRLPAEPRDGERGRFWLGAATLASLIARRRRSF